MNNYKYLAIALATIGISGCQNKQMGDLQASHVPTHYVWGNGVTGATVLGFKGIKGNLGPMEPVVLVKGEGKRSLIELTRYPDAGLRCWISSDALRPEGSPIPIMENP